MRATGAGPDGSDWGLSHICYRHRQGCWVELITALKGVDPGAAIIAISGKSPSQKETW